MDITGFVVSLRDSALLVGDYKTYHAQTTRQLASKRKKLGRATPKNAKFAAKAPVTAEDIGGNVEFVHLILLTAERAYAHAMSMKASATDDNAGFPGSTRRQIVSRLNKAAKQAEHLATILSNKTVTHANDRDILEAKAYAQSLSGAEEFEKHAQGQRSSDREAQRDKWHDCLVSYSTARVIYAALLKSTKKELYKDLLAGTVDPSIRFAAYQSHIPRTLPAVTVSRRFFPKEDKELVKSVTVLDSSAFEDEKSERGKSTGAANIPDSVKWRSRKASIVDAAIGQALAAVSSAEERLIETLDSDKSDSAKDRAAAYDEVLIAAQDASDATRHAIEEHEKERIPEADPRMQDLRVTNLAVNYDLIGWRVGRNRVLIGEDDGAALEGPALKNPKRPRKDGQEWVDKPEGNGRKLARLRERVVLYDAILQSIDSVKDLPGAVRDSTFVEELDGKRAYFQALKCLNIANSHVLLSSHRNSLALLLRAGELSSTAVSALSSKAPEHPDIYSLPRLDVSDALLKSLHNRIEAQTLHTRALVELHKHNENSTLAAKKGMTTAAPVVETLDTYPSSGTVDLNNLVQWPPKLRPVPVKPLFLDVAWNYIDYPGRKAAKGESTKDGEAEKSQQKKGWFGFGR